VNGGGKVLKIIEEAGGIGPRTERDTDMNKKNLGKEPFGCVFTGKNEGKIPCRLLRGKGLNT